MLCGVRSFDNLHELRIEYDIINDQELVPYDIFGQNAESKFPKLKKLSLRKQCMGDSFSNLMSMIARLPSLTDVAMLYCKFSHSSSVNQDGKSTTLRSLTLNTIKLNKKRLSQISNCFGRSLECIQFIQCKLPKNKSIWTNFAANCNLLENIFCDKICSSITSLCEYMWCTEGPFFLKCKQISDPIIFESILNEAFKDKSNINIIVKKPKITPKRFHHKPLQIGYMVENKASSESQTMTEECKMCQAKVAIGFMNDHLDSMCVNQLIECVLCSVKIERKDLVDHWHNDCKQYILRCNDCGVNFNDKVKYYEHLLLHRTRDDTLKRRYHFGNVHNDKHRKDFCDDKSIELAEKCKVCQRLYMCKESEHQCPEECIDWGYTNMTNVCKLCNSLIPIGKMRDHLECICVKQVISCCLCEKQVTRQNMVMHWNTDCDGYEKSQRPLSMMRHTLPSLKGRDVIEHWTRHEIKNYHVPSEIFSLIVLFFCGQ